MTSKQYLKDILNFIWIFIVTQIALTFINHKAFTIQLIGACIAIIIDFLVCYFIYRQIKKDNHKNYPSDPNFKDFNKKKLGQILINSIIWIFIFIIVVGLLYTIVPHLLGLNISYLKTHTSTNQATLNQLFTNSSINLIAYVIIVTLFDPLYEEYIYRYLIIKPKTSYHLRNVKNIKRYRIIATTIAITIFALVHMINQYVMIHSVTDQKMAILFTFQYLILSSVLGLQYFKSSSIIQTTSTHMLINLLSITQLFI